MPNPSITYGKLPLPDLPEFNGEQTPSADRASCPVCGSLDCRARASAAEPGTLRRRLTELQAALQDGEEATWQWAQREMHKGAGNTPPSGTPLCFLIALGETAKLQRRTLDRLRRSFEARKHSPKP